jgi:hypothetical protein
MAGRTATTVSVEVGAKRVFAWAHDWPGWCRAGKTEEAALAALADYLDRYIEVVRIAGLRIAAHAADRLTVADRLPGSASTEFGVPHAIGPDDRQRLTAAQGTRRTALVRAAWTYFDDVVASTPAELRKGPRGGGRDRDKMVGHVLEAESSYARTIGVRLPVPAVGDTAAIAAARGTLATALAQPAREWDPAAKGWPLRYAHRRIAWHVLDHAWEMQDRAT